MLPAIQPHLPAAPVPPLPSDIEVRIGQLTAAVAGMIAAGLQDQRNGGLRPDTKRAAAEAITQLILLRRDVAGEVDDFELVARREGYQALRQFCERQHVR